MHVLFSEEGNARLAQFAQPGLLCAFDFDGTLAPIVLRPEQARLPDEIRRHLIALSAYAPIAIITGRSVEDIHSRLGFEPDFIIGNHGLEGVPGWEVKGRRHQALCMKWRMQLAAALKEYDPAIQLEDKRYSLSVHYRHARDGQDAETRLRRLFSLLDPQPRIVSGKYVFNLLPPDSGHKGSALVQVMAMSGARNAIYVGDDVTDEDVFRLGRSDVLSIRIEHASDSAAEFFVPRPEDIVRLLTELVGRLSTSGALNRVQTALSQYTDHA